MVNKINEKRLFHFETPPFEPENEAQNTRLTLIKFTEFIYKYLSL